MSEIFPDQPSEAGQHAAELTELASRQDSPGARAFLLQWANAFQKLAALGEKSANNPEEGDD